MFKNAKIYCIVLSIAAVLLMLTLYEVKLQGEENNMRVAMIIIGTTILSCMLSVAIYGMEKIDAMIAFKIVAPTIALLFIMAMPVFKSHDEDSHWIRIYDISQGNFLTSTKYGHLIQEGAQNYPAGEIPRAVYTVIDKSYAGCSTKELLDIKLDEKDTFICAMPTTAIYSPTQYLLQAIGVAVTRIFTDRPIIMAYAARIMNIIVSFTALYFAIKFMPFGKKILLAIMCVPIALEGFCSLSPDGMTISLSFLFIAYLLHLAIEKKDERLTWKQSVGITILGVLLALCKIVYLPIVGLILLLPRTKFSSRKSQILHIAIMLGIAVVANLAWLSISTGYLAEYKEGRPVEQLNILLSNPIEYIEKVLYSINLRGSQYFLSMLGGEVGLNEYVRLHVIIPVCYFILILIATFCTREERPKFSTYQVVIMLMIVLSIVGLIFTSLYLQWTTTDSDSILGVQGRYFLPVLPLALLLLSCLKVKLNYSDVGVTKCIVIGILMMQIYIIPLVFLIRNVIL